MSESENLAENVLDEIELLVQVVGRICMISMNQAGIKTDGRGMRAMKLFTRQTLSAVSLTKLMPSDEDVYESLDIPSYASITRNIMECFISIYYYGTESVSESEAELRFILLQYHRNSEWFNIRKEDLDRNEHEEFVSGLKGEKERLKTHPFIAFLDADEKNKVLRGYEMYKSKAFFESKLPVCSNISKDYRLLSNLVHPLPLSVERINNSNGRGHTSEADLRYFLIFTMLSRKYLAATAIEIRNKFQDTLGKRFSKDFEFLEPLVTKGFTSEKV